METDQSKVESPFTKDHKNGVDLKNHSWPLFVQLLAVLVGNGFSVIDMNSCEELFVDHHEKHRTAKATDSILVRSQIFLSRQIYVDVNSRSVSSYQSMKFPFLLIIRTERTIHATSSTWSEALFTVGRISQTKLIPTFETHGLFFTTQNAL